MGESVVIVRRTLGAVDEYGNPTATVSQITVENCLVGWGSSSEPALADADPVTTQMTLYMPSETEVLDGDEFIVRGDYFVKNGMAQQWASMLNVSKGVVVGLRRRDG